MEQYEEMYRRSLDDADAFWAEEAEKRLHWFKKWDYVQNHDFDERAKIRWFEGGKLNVAYNCLDRHLEAGKGDKVAYYFEGDSPDSTRTITYRQLWEEVTKFANVLKKKGVKKGDRVVIYLPMIPELPVAMLACARIGAIHCVVFGGFSADALRDRVLNAGATLMITADTGLRGGKPDPAQDRRRRGHGGVPGRQDLHRGQAHRQRASPGPKAATAGTTTSWLPPTSPPTARAKRWTRKIRSSSSTPPAPRANPRASCTPPVATCSTPA